MGPITDILSLGVYILVPVPACSAEVRTFPKLVSILLAEHIAASHTLVKRDPWHAGSGVGTCIWTG